MKIRMYTLKSLLRECPDRAMSTSKLGQVLQHVHLWCQFTELLVIRVQEKCDATLKILYITVFKPCIGCVNASDVGKLL